MPDITSANSVITLSVPDYMPVPVQLQGFATDDVFSTARTVPVETQLGVDGFFAGGFVFTEKRMELMLNAASPSNDWFEQLNLGMEAFIQAFEVFGVLSLPALRKTFTLDTGFLTGYPPMADAKRVLQPRRYELTWRRIAISPISVAG